MSPKNIIFHSKDDIEAPFYVTVMIEMLFFLISYDNKEQVVKVSCIYVYFPLQGSNLKNASFHMGDVISMAVRYCM
jgi:hypothetical protein